MDHTFNSKERDILGGKENTVMVKDYIPCPTPAKVSVAVVHFGEPTEPTASFFGNYNQTPIHRVSTTLIFVLRPCPWSEIIGPRMATCSVLSQSVPSPLESLGLDLRDASPNCLNSEMQMWSRHCNSQGKRNRDSEKQHWRSRDRRAPENQLLSGFLEAFSSCFQILPFLPWDAWKHPWILKIIFFFFLN